MKKILLPIFLLAVSISLFAQAPDNDDCDGLIDLGTIPLCPDTVWYTNVDATESSIGNDNFPSGCDGGDFSFVGRDVWFQFSTNDTLIDIKIEVTGINDPSGSTPMSNPQVALYRGDCSFDNLSLVSCGRAEDGENVISINVVGLDPNTPYYIRVNDWSNTATPNSGTFQLCIGEPDPVFDICGDGSLECEGVLYDCGGPDEDYENNQNESFTICPDQNMNECITFTLEYYNIDQFGDALTFYDGPDTNSPVIGGVSGAGGVTGGGGVCYTVQASSGCLTVGFVTDGATTFEGFCGSWDCSSAPCEGLDPIDVNPTATDAELADAVTTPQTQAVITDVNCPEGAYGTFTADNSDLGLEKGIILTSGSIDNVVGPNTQTGATTSHFTPGDADLDVLSTNGNSSNDACVVEMDVFVATDELSFEFVFGSDEYLEWANSAFTDIFALLVSGPGIVGDPAIGNQLNTAIVPNTNDLIEVNTVNNEVNWEYYRNNEGGQSIEYDGLTSDYLGIKKSLTAAVPVIPCTTYHLKFAIADRTDSALDSGVFIAELKGGVPELTVNFASGVDYLVEDCTGASDVLLITLNNPLPDTASYDVMIGGTAMIGDDYILDIPAQIVLEPGETQLAFPLIPLTDGILEGIETILITLTNNFGCGDIPLTEIEIEIHDTPLVEIFAGADSVFACDGECLQLSAEGGVTYQWDSEEAGIFDDATSPTPLACPTFNQWVEVEGFISALPGCSDVDSVFLSIVDPMVDVIAGPSTNICQGESVQLVANNNVGSAGIMWTPDDWLDADDVPAPVATPQSTITYTATVNVSGCTASDQITINVDTFDPISLTTTDTTLCQGSVLLLADSIDNTTTTYQWSPDDYIITDTDISGAVTIPEGDITYTVIVTSENAYCADTLTVDVTAIPADVEINEDDYLEICLGDSVNLTTTNTTNGVGITWMPDIELSTTTGGETWASPTETTLYYTTLVVGQCTIIDSVLIRVDSLPDMDIFPIPDNNPYCKGDIIALTSPTYVEANFPDMEHLWTPVIGAESDTTNYNLVITATETFTYTRYTNNHACLDTQSIEIIVIDPNAIEVTPEIPIFCVGDSIQLNATSPDTDDFVWSPSNTLSCEECPDPIASPTGTTEYLVEADVNGCPITATIEVVVVQYPLYTLPSISSICNGQSVVLNSSPADPNATYSWTSDPAGFTSSDPNPTVMPTVPTTYMLSIGNNYCGPTEDQVFIDIDIDPVLTVSDDVTICEGEFTELVATGNTNGTYEWSNGSTDAVNEVTRLPGEYMYYVSFTNGCGTVEDSVMLTVLDAIIIDGFVYSPDPVGDTYFEGDQISISVLTSGGSTNGATYEWIFDNVLSPETGSVLNTFFGSNNPTPVEVTITSPNGCTAEEVEEIEIEVLEWKMPNAFTPDADGNNDYFNVVKNGNWREMREFVIYNRWGIVVYNNETPDQGWDGTHKGKPAPSDTYIYKIVFERFTGEVQEEQGEINLIR